MAMNMQVLQTREDPDYSHVWRRLYNLGSWLAARGESLQERAAALPYMSFRTDEDEEIRRALYNATLATHHLGMKYEVWRRTYGVEPGPLPLSDEGLDPIQVQGHVLWHLWDAARFRCNPLYLGNLTRSREGYAPRAVMVANLREHIERSVAYLLQQQEELQGDLEGQGTFEASNEDEATVDANDNTEETNTAVSAIAVPVTEAMRTEQCPICLNEYEEGPDGPVRLVCNHVVGAECLDTWVNSHHASCNTCPLCRAELFPRRPDQTGGIEMPADDLDLIFGPITTAEWAEAFEFAARQARLEENIRLLRGYSGQLAAILHELCPALVGGGMGR